MGYATNGWLGHWENGPSIHGIRTMGEGTERLRDRSTGQVKPGQAEEAPEGAHRHRQVQVQVAGSRHSRWYGVKSMLAFNVPRHHTIISTQ